MPKKPANTDETPEALRPYLFHGVDLNVPKTGREALGECPFCGGDKFSVNMDNSMFQCWSSSCEIKGNSTTFLRQFWELCKEGTTNKQYEQLAKDSGFLKPHAARSFGCVMSTLRLQWLVPGWNHENKLTGLYRYGRMKNNSGEWKDRLLVCPGTGHHLFNLQNYDSGKPIVDLCEGWRDGIALLESLTMASTGNRYYIEDRSVLAVPGASSFKSQWCKFFAGKTVNIWFDNDYPKDNKGVTYLGAGLKGVKRVGSILASSPTPPESINYVAWNGSVDQYSLDLPESMDIRDFITQ